MLKVWTFYLFSENHLVPCFLTIPTMETSGLEEGLWWGWFSLQTFYFQIYLMLFFLTFLDLLWELTSKRSWISVFLCTLFFHQIIYQDWHDHFHFVTLVCITTKNRFKMKLIWSWPIISVLKFSITH